MSHLANTIIHALDSEAQDQRDGGRQHLGDALARIACRVQRAVSDGRIAEDEAIKAVNKLAGAPLGTMILDTSHPNQADIVIAAVMRERDEARKEAAAHAADCRAAHRQLADAKKTAHEMMKAREDRIAYLEDAINGRREGEKKMQAKEAAATLRAERAEKALTTEQARVTALRAENADLRAQRLAGPAADALKALAADTLDIVRTFHNEGAQPGESLARYVARNVETLRAALRTVLLPLTMLTHHRGQFRPEDGLLDKLADLARRPQS